MPRTRRSNPGDSLWLSPAQQRAWVTYMRVQLRMNYEINRQLQRDSGLSLADYHVLNALNDKPRLQTASHRSRRVHRMGT
jgi:hypothetical protein